jgi:hypothetical protein
VLTGDPLASTVSIFVSWKAPGLRRSIPVIVARDCSRRGGPPGVLMSSVAAICFDGYFEEVK